jgi:ubiquinone/menaquinone biosynthesis C-methylase UbiE
MKGKSFDIITCIESYHCLRHGPSALKQAYDVLNKEGSLVIADAFNKEDVDHIEEEFRSVGYVI